MNLVQVYWQRAEEFRKLALHTGIREHRETIEKIADTWATMASELERREQIKRNASPSGGESTAQPAERYTEGG